MKRLPTLVFLLIIAVSTSSAQKPPKVSNPVLRASFVYCAPEDLGCQAANRVRQDMNAEFVHGENSVTVQFQLGSGSRDLTIGLPTTSRSVYMDFSVQVNAGTFTPSFLPNSPVQLVKPYINVLAAYRAKEDCPAEQAVCEFRTRANMGGWRASGDATTDYACLWNPTASLARPVNSPDPTSEVMVTYHRDYLGTGETFIISPILTPDGYALAGVEASYKRKLHGAGQYDMPFTLTARPK